ncbi:hypothetical protein L3V82_13250 [Thiotrichales bacterium 19S3-7]|nr:hypothetical protein [Thiotrichales bacterium 19S3-7]MCF6803134.1 hypothetical protein [Thiotrichales bacterium 19S3-11]
MKDVYVIDYSTDDDQQFCIFELQRFNSSQNHYWSKERKVQDAYGFRSEMSDLSGRYLYDLPRYLDAEKYMQRILLQQNKH